MTHMQEPNKTSKFTPIQHQETTQSPKPHQENLTDSPHPPAQKESFFERTPETRLLMTQPSTHIAMLSRAIDPVTPIQEEEEKWVVEMREERMKMRATNAIESERILIGLVGCWGFSFVDRGIAIEGGGKKLANNKP
ncbi:hypothetical protein AKJ16_DCAP04835 [Drosera capensis]